MADDVTIVGAGPTGLLLAGDLAAAGVPCTVLERRAGESNLTRAFAVPARTLELLDAGGLAAGGRSPSRGPGPGRPSTAPKCSAAGCPPSRGFRAASRSCSSLRST